MESDGIGWDQMELCVMDSLILDASINESDETNWNWVEYDQTESGEIE